MTLPPHPRDTFVLGSSRAFLDDILQTFVDGWRECGDVVWFRAPRAMYILAHPDHAQHVLEDHHEQHPRSGYNRALLLNVMGRGLFNVDDDGWRRQHPMVSAPFGDAHTAGHVVVMARATSRMLDRWQAAATDGRMLDVQAEMVQLGLDTMGEILWGEEWDPQSALLREAFTDSADFAIPRVTGFPGPLEVLTPAYRRWRRGQATLDAAIARAVAARRVEPREDLISTLVATRGDGPDAQLTDVELRDTVKTFLFGAYKGAPVGLTWLFHRLATHLDVRGKVEAEVDRELLPGDAARTPEDLARLPYIAMVCHEVLRLYPPIWGASRPPRDDEVIGGYVIPKHVYLLAIPYLTHRHPEFWEDPEAFDPERFTPERSVGRHPYAYFPFGRGHRSCIAEAYGLAQMRLVTAEVTRRYRLELAPGHQVQRASEFLTRPSNGMPMRVRAREAPRV